MGSRLAGSSVGGSTSGRSNTRRRRDLKLLVDTLVDESDGDYSRGDLSLREAIELANASNHDGVIDTIRFDPALTAAGPAAILLVRSQLQIRDSVVIEGPGAALLTIDTRGTSRVFDVDDGVADGAIDVSLMGLTLTGGKVSDIGGGIRNSENLSLVEMRIRSNAAVRGGGVASRAGNVRIVSSDISDNTAHFGGGAAISNGNLEIIGSSIARNIANTQGGGLHVTHQNGKSIRIEDSTIEENLVRESSSMLDGGGGIFATVVGVGTTFEMLNSTVADNRVESRAEHRDLRAIGGGIRLSVGSDATAWIVQTVVSNNSADSVFGQGSGGGLSLQAQGGTAFVQRSAFRGNMANFAGGGILASGTFGGKVTLEENELDGNSAKQGGGGQFGGKVRFNDGLIKNNSAEKGGGLYWYVESGPNEFGIVRTTIERNIALEGGGIYGSGVGNLKIAQSLIAHNTADLGGGIYTQQGMALTNVTVSGNSANVGGGVFAASGFGTIKHSTITANETRGVGHGIYLQSGPLEIENSIVASNVGPTQGDILAVGNAKINSRYSLIGSNFGSGLSATSGGIPDANGNLVGGNSNPIIPKLGSLADNGGPTRTHGLLPGSPAINAGSPGASADFEGVPAHDQRGAPFTRVYGGRIDMGAVERLPEGLLPGDYNLSGHVDAADYTVWRDTRGARGDVQADGNGDGVVDARDYGVWKSNFGTELADLGGSGQGQVLTVSVEDPQPAVSLGEPPAEPGADASDRQIGMSLMHAIQPPAQPGVKSVRRPTVTDEIARQDRAIEAWWAARTQQSFELRETVNAKGSQDEAGTAALDRALAELAPLRLAIGG